MQYLAEELTQRGCRYGAMPRSTSSRSRSSGWPSGCRRCTRGATSPCSSSRARRPVAARLPRLPCHCLTAGNLRARRSPCQVCPSPTPSLTVPSVGTAPVSFLQPAAASAFFVQPAFFRTVFSRCWRSQSHVASEHFQRCKAWTGQARQLQGQHHHHW